MKLSKAEKKAIIIRYLARACASQHHNAQPNYPRINDDALAEEFEYWLEYEREIAFESFRDNLSLSKSYNACKPYVEYYSLNRGTKRTSRVSEIFNPYYYLWYYGKDVINDGRGGATVAMDNLYCGKYSPESYENWLYDKDFDKVNNADLTSLIRAMWWFDDYVHTWNKNVAKEWCLYLLNKGEEE